MRTKEFVEKIEALGYDVKNDCDTLLVKSDGEIICDVSNSEFGILDTDSYVGFKQITVEKRKEILLILADYALTDPADREEEKRYWLQRIEPPILGEQDPRYLFYTRVGGYYDIGTTKSEWRNVTKTIFTESEIAEMDITGFEKIEVTP